jgi:SAM-dependent methyltransferase
VAAAEFFPPEIEDLIKKLGLIWTGAPVDGDLDCPIFWDTKPEISIITDLLIQKLGAVVEVPLFPSVFYYNNIYDQNLLEAALPMLGGCEDILVLGCGAGLEAICIALQYGVHVDATDINPIAIANTMAACRRTGTDALVSGWVSDGFFNVKKSYDAILFEAPLTTREIHLTDPNRYDFEGKLLREVLRMLPAHLKTGGRMYLMSRPDLTPYLPEKGLKWKVLRCFAENMSLAILEIWPG